MVIQPREGELTVYPLMINELIYILQVKWRNRLLISTQILQIYFGNIILALSKKNLVNGKPVAAHIMIYTGTSHKVCYLLSILSTYS